MNANIKYLKDESGKVFSPIVNIKSIFDDSGTTVLDLFYPIGSYFETSNDEFNPNTSWGGTWLLDTIGLVTVCANPDYVDDPQQPNTALNIQLGVITGEVAHKTTISEMPRHLHTGIAYNSSFENPEHVFSVDSGSSTSDPKLSISWSGADKSTYQKIRTTYTGGVIGEAGVGVPHNNIQPSIGVYRWHRTA